VKYPNGKSFTPNSFQSGKPVSYGNRGMNLEQKINLTNTYYLEQDKAVIYKKPTPIKISEVDYKNKGKIITKAFFECPSTTDYNGIYKGKYIDFEAKETTSKTSFPLHNIHEHQIEHMMRICAHGGICFLIVQFTTLDKIFLLPAEQLKKFLTLEKRSSIPLSFFTEFAHPISEGYHPRLDYLKIVDKIYGGNNNE